ncbi:histidine phosphatase family protein [uncultured Roseobacter sp.]|uniref:histidine phosphatase family protein n=1 Tax=uncultured Roseobacter sp. TaxID=114847 RepID=UPI0026064B3F|nr:histidine phosphatase family protein [uncultured Roseobacter sp.]
MIRLALLRHGHTAWNRAGRIQGRSDVPLDEETTATLATRTLPSPWKDAALWSSPLSRARATAALVAGRSPQIDPALTEMDWGQWEGQQGSHLRSDPDSGFRDIEDWGWDYRPPGGESPRDLRARLLPWAAALDRDAVAVCHIGVMRVLLAHAMGWDFRGTAPFRIKRERLYVLTRTQTGWTADPDPVRLEARTP